MVREKWVNVGDGECSKGYDCPVCSPSRCEFYRKDVEFRGCEVRPIRVLFGITGQVNDVEKQIGKDLFLTEEAAKARAFEIEAAEAALAGKEDETHEWSGTDIYAE